MEEENIQCSNGLCPAVETKENDSKTMADEYLNPETKKFKEGNPGGGRPKETEEQKIAKKASKQLIEEYKEALAQALPALSPVLVKKASDGDLGAIKEVNDRVMGKPQQDITSGGEAIQPLLVRFINEETDNNTDTTGVQTPV